MRPVENNYWSPGVNISWKLTALPWHLDCNISSGFWVNRLVRRHKTLSETFYSNVYPVSWGDGMHEVVAGDPNQNETTNWIVNFFQVPNLGEFIKYDTMFKRYYPFLHMHFPACSIFWVGRLQTPVYMGRWKVVSKTWHNVHFPTSFLIIRVFWQLRNYLRGNFTRNCTAAGRQ